MSPVTEKNQQIRGTIEPSVTKDFHQHCRVLATFRSLQSSTKRTSHSLTVSQHLKRIIQTKLKSASKPKIEKISDSAMLSDTDTLPSSPPNDSDHLFESLCKSRKETESGIVGTTRGESESAGMSISRGFNRTLTSQLTTVAVLQLTTLTVSFREIARKLRVVLEGFCSFPRQTYSEYD